MQPSKRPPDSELHKGECLQVVPEGATRVVNKMSAKFSLAWQRDQLMQERKKQEAARDKLVDYARTLQTCNVKNSWLQSSNDRVMRKNAERSVMAALQEQESGVEERRRRLWRLLQDEEVQLLQDMEGKSNRETPEERQAKMAERAKALREKRETERKQLVDNKLDQLFRDKCQELRNNQSRQLAQHVSADRAGQLRSRKEQLERLRQEDDMFNRLWAADGRAKEERERQRVQKEQERGEELMKELKMQMEASEEQRRRDRELKEEEAHLLVRLSVCLLTCCSSLTGVCVQRQQQEVLQLQMQREQHQKLQLQVGRRQQLDESLREKMQRTSREEQDELQMDLQVLHQLLEKERQEAADKKVKLRCEQLRHIQYVQEELQKQKQTDEQAQRLRDEQLQEAYEQREKQIQLQRDARRRMMEEIMATRRVQIAEKLRVNREQQLELLREREELNYLIEEMNIAEAEEKQSQRQACVENKLNLQEQVKERQQNRRQQAIDNMKEAEQMLMQEYLYDLKEEEVLNRPRFTGVPLHPLRRGRDFAEFPEEDLPSPPAGPL
ncbi:cilia- and flagella-associated protein 53-like isoform X1 [Synchiropus splendidus]|uniref:cilia- and flagella-associated protein 53-like isoform X1 n=2 Tax=Synchiropus splendidus TaxID=270530 RepID=UPI00237EE938|nr:cilia- and flagella-associated protein 53-like isoform X1 [Synchiropus splendidus]